MMREIKQTLTLKQVFPHQYEFLREETTRRVDRQRQGRAD